MVIKAYQDTTPNFDDSVYIDDSAMVIGQVCLGKDSSVWPMSVVRGDVNRIDIGERTNIQDGSVLHVTHDGEYSPGGASLSIGNEVTIGHKAMLHACTIEDLCLIGMSAVVLDKVLIPKYTIIGANSLVPAGKQLEPGYLWVGSPVQPKRQLTKQEIAHLSYSAAHYVRLKNNYLQSIG